MERRSRPRSCSRHARRGARRLREGGAGAAAARCARPAELQAARRGARRCLPQVDPPGGADARSPQSRLPPSARGRRDRGVPHRGWHDPRGSGAGDRLRRSDGQRLPGGQSVHGHREQAHAAAGRSALRQWPAAGSDRAQKRGGRGGHHLDRVAAAPDLQGRAAGAVRHERAADGLRRNPGPRRDAHCRAGVVQAVAHDFRGEPGRSPPSRAAGGHRGAARAAALPCPGARLRRLRGRTRREARQEDGRLPPVPRRAGRGGRNATRGRARARGGLRGGRGRQV